MPLIWSAISAHGYGHAAQVIPVLNELGRRIPSLKIVLRTNVPAHFFESRMTVPWELRPAQLDIGCLQHGPITMDWEATWQAHRLFHANWEARLKEETAAIRESGADLVIGNNPYLAMAACLAAGLYGIQNKLKLKQTATTGNGYRESSKGILPATLIEATRMMDQSPLSRKLLGKAFVDHFVQSREWEWRQHLKAVTDWEYQRYFEII